MRAWFPLCCIFVASPLVLSDTPRYGNVSRSAHGGSVRSRQILNYTLVVEDTSKLQPINQTPTPPGPTSGPCVPLQGDGSVQAGWPLLDQWLSYDDIWHAQQLGSGCVWTLPNGTVYAAIPNSLSETSMLNQSIHDVARKALVDPRVVLVMVAQESSGCVRVFPTVNSVFNPGLMQSHNGAGSCFMVNPCPQTEINQMIEDGVRGDAIYSLVGGLNIAIGSHGAQEAMAYYQAVSIYNRGLNAFSSSDLGTYAGEIAHRLMGISVVC